MRDRRLSTTALVAAALALPGVAVAQQAPAENAPAQAAMRAAALQQAMAVAQQRAAAGDAVAQQFLAQAYNVGNLYPKDLVASYRWAMRAAASGHARAQAQVAWAYAYGLGVKADPAKAIEYATLSAEQGDAVGIRVLGRFYQTGIGVPANAKEAAALYVVAALMGDDAAAFSMGSILQDGAKGIEKDPQSAAVFFTVARQRGYRLPDAIAAQVQTISADAITDLTEIANAKDMKDGGRELSWFAQTVLGRIYVDGRGVPIDVATGIGWLKRAADSGNVTAQAELAQIYLRGAVVPRNNPEALRYFQLAAKQGSAEGLYGVGLYHQYGNGLPVDFAKANQNYNQAVRKMSSLAAFRLGIINRDGLGVAADPAVANYWFAVAVQRGYRGAEAFLRTGTGATRTVATTGVQRPDPGGTARPVATGSVPAGPRIALVIGNSAYSGTLQPLPNPANDADLIGNSLRQTGFDVQVVKNADQQAMQAAIARFAERVRNAGAGATAMFYYAGHGVQSKGVNYLVPVKVPIGSESDLGIYAVPADIVLRQLEDARAMTNIIVLDACRNNPFPANTRSISAGGLARMDSRNGSFIAYSTAPGDTAADGSGANSPYSQALARSMLTPGEPVEQVFKNVRRSVLQATNGVQTPWDSSSLTADFAFRAK